VILALKTDMMRAEDLNQLIRERRSVYPKQYDSRPVDDGVINQMLENARWAPNHKLTEPWHFVVFAREGLKKLAAFQSECYKEVTTRNGSFKEDKYKGLQVKPLEASHVIAVGMRRDDKRSLPEIEEVGAVFCAVQNMYLTAAAYGIGCYFTTGGVTFFEEAKPFYGLRPEDKLLGSFYVGTIKTPSPPGKRIPVEQKSRWIVG
jgi:nitroreductase